MYLDLHSTCYGQAGHHNTHHRHELDEDVEARAGGVLKWVAHGVAHYGGLVAG